MVDEAKSTKTDPLSSATRATKRNLLAVCLVAVVYRAFNVTIEKIPLAGVDIRFEQGTFEALLLIALVYFSATFLLYYLIDIGNFTRPRHQDDAENRWTDARTLFIGQEQDAAAAQISREVLSVSHNAALNNQYRIQLSEWLTRGPLGFFSAAGRILTYAFDGGEAISVTTSGGRARMPIYEPSEEELRLKSKGAAVLRRRSRLLLVRYFFFLVLNRPRLWTVRSMYFLRNVIVDGIFPMLAAAYALLSLYNIIDVHWLAHISPRAPGT